MPPMPRAMSRPSEPVGRQATSCASASSPSFMMAPLPNCFSIWLTARSIARSRFTSMLMSHPPPHEAPGPPGPNFPETDPLYPGARQVSSRAGYIFSTTDAPQGVPGHRRVQGPRGLETALVENDLGGRPGAERRGARGLDRRGERAPGAWRAHAGDGQVPLDGAPLRDRAQELEGEVELGRIDPADIGVRRGGADTRLSPGDRRAYVRAQIDGDEAAHGGAVHAGWRIGWARVIA